MTVGEARPWRGGAAPNRFGERGIIVVFSLLLVVLAGMAVLVAALEKPPPPSPACPKPGICANPPRRVTVASGAAASPSSPLNGGVPINKSAYHGAYPAGSIIGDETSTAITIYLRDGITTVHIDGATNSTAPQQMEERMIAFVQANHKIPDLHPDKDPEREILSPALAGWAGVGGLYQGNYTSPTGIVSPADVAILAASDGQDTIGAVVIAADRHQTDLSFGYADQLILDTLRFRGGAPQ